MSDFKWDDKLVAEFGKHFYLNLASDKPVSEYLKDCLEDFKALKRNAKGWEVLVSINEERTDGEQVIKSVRRLSDGEVFSVGDMVQAIGLNYKAPITKFAIESGELRVLGTDISTAHKFWSVINGISKVKQPLFTTDDGVLVRADAKVFTVALSRDYHILLLNAQDASFCKEDGIKLKSFSTIESAEEYVLMNKPCLSVNDITSISKFLTKWRVESAITELKELAKSKLNNR